MGEDVNQCKALIDAYECKTGGLSVVITGENGSVPILEKRIYLPILLANK